LKERKKEEKRKKKKFKLIPIGICFPFYSDFIALESRDGKFILLNQGMGNC